MRNLLDAPADKRARMGMIERALDFLLEAQNPDGGWGAEKGKTSNTEATSFALLAVGASGDRSRPPAIDRGLDWLSHRQDSDGSWPLSDQVPEGSWVTSLAVLSLASFKPHRPEALRGAGWLLRQEARGVGWYLSLRYRLAPERQANRLNPELKGWPWISGTFSWVEPTAYALIALKKLRPFPRPTEAEERIRQGELMIYDRMCEGGGWNYGNAQTVGVNLWPYPDITAIALVALQDHPAAKHNQLSLEALEKMMQQTESGLSLSWSVLCFSLYGRDTTGWEKLLARNYEKTRFLGEIKTTALALLALAGGARFFRV